MKDGCAPEIPSGCVWGDWIFPACSLSSRRPSQDTIRYLSSSKIIFGIVVNTGLNDPKPKFFVRKIPWRRKWQPAPVFLTGEFHWQRSLVGQSTGFPHCTSHLLVHLSGFYSLLCLLIFFISSLSVVSRTLSSDLFWFLFCSQLVWHNPFIELQL